MTARPPTPGELGQVLKRISVPAGAVRFEVPAPFVPDFWQISLPDAISTVISILAPWLSDSWPLTGTGQCAFPGADRETKLLIDNPGAAAVSLLIYASRGLPPSTFTPPVSLAKPASANPLQMDFQNLAPGSTVATWNISHPGGPLLVGIAARTAISGANFSSLTAGGQPMVKVGQASDGVNMVLSVWKNVDIPAGTITLTATCSQTISNCRVVSLSFSPGVGFGTSNVLNTNTTGTCDITTTQPSSVAWCFAFYGSTTGQETSGAPWIELEVGIGFGTMVNSLFKRIVQGLATFAFSPAEAYRIVTVETYVP